MPIDEEGNLIPDFGGGSNQEKSQVGEGGASSPGYSGPRKMCFICSKGNLDMAYPALIMGNAALSEGIEVDYFFTFWGLDIIDVRTMDDLKFSYAGNTAMHMPQMERFVGGGATMGFPQMLAGVPGMTAFGTKMLKSMMAKQDIPTIPEFLDHLSAMGAHMYACQLSAEMMQFKKPMLHPGVEGIISAADFIELSEGAQIIFV